MLLHCKYDVSSCLVIIQKVQLRNSGVGNKYIFDTFSKTKSACVVKLLGTILMRKYPEFHENRLIPLADLLEWELWPTYITIYGMNNYLHVTLWWTNYYTFVFALASGHKYTSTNNQTHITHTYLCTHTAQGAGATKEESKRPWESICKCALHVLQDLHTRIDCGDISIRELHEVHCKKDQMFKLYSATVVDGKQWVNLPSTNTIFANMDQRFKEYQHFLVYQLELGYTLIFLNPRNLPGNLL